jgi:Collagen triple helix repeat (20 copies)
MFSKIRKRFTYTNLALTLALVFAMTGGAYAAGKYVITSTKQISPKVLKSLQGKAGPAGPAGAAGAAGAGTAGAQGPQGPAGTAGAKGEPGTNGTPGTKGETGKEGPEGKSGFTSTLPSGKTETGEFAYTQENAAEEEPERYAISFPIPLAAAVVPHFIAPGAGNPIGCSGNAEKPVAAAGNLCVFASAVQAATFATFQDAGSFSSTETGLTGDTLVFRAKTEENIGIKAEAQWLGTWAVTAE